MKPPPKVYPGQISARKPARVLHLLCVCALLALPLLPATLHAAGAPSSPAGPQFIAERPFWGGITYGMAAQAAKAAVRQSAMQAVARELVARPDVQFIGKAGSTPIPQDPLALAYATARLRELDAQSLGRPLDARVALRVALVPPGDQHLRQALLQPARLDLYGRAAARETTLLAEYDDAVRLMAEKKDSPRSTRQGNATANAAPTPAELMALAKALEGVDLYLAALPSFSDTWQDPEKINRAMQRILTLDPDSALAANAYGESCLLLGRPQEALEAQSKALRLDPGFARAFHARGAANLALGLPALAVADFSEAIRLAPHTAMYRRDRAAAWLVREETGPMCQDFRDACALGDCSGYQWALAQGRCPDGNKITTQ